MREMTELEVGEWLICLSSWVIQDGNYEDFELGQRRQFALEFMADELHAAEPCTKSVLGLGEGAYEVIAEVRLSDAVGDERLNVLDFGLLAYSDARLEKRAAGSWIAGRLVLSVDCYSYYEIHAKRDDVPAAVYTWAITGIWRQTAPFIPGGTEYMKLMVRDPERLGYMPLEKTDAWSDDEGHGEYVLRCRLEPDAPTRHPRPAGTR